MQGASTQTTAGPVQVTLFGTMQFFRSTDAGLVVVPVRFKTKKSRLLLAYLLLHPGKENQRERLAYLFWPESDSESGRRSLRDALGFVKDALEAAGFSETGLYADRDTISLTSTVFATDVAAFETALRQTNGRAIPPIDPTTESQIAALENAVGLYHGSFLEGFSSIDGADDWIGEVRKKYKGKFNGALARLASLHQEMGDLPAALDYARRATENEPGDAIYSARFQEINAQIRLQTQGAAATLIAPQIDPFSDEDVTQAANPPDKLPTDNVPTNPPFDAAAGFPSLDVPFSPLPQTLNDAWPATAPAANAAPRLSRRAVLGGGAAGVAVLGTLGFTVAQRFTRSKADLRRPWTPNDNLVSPNAYLSPDAKGMEEKDYDDALTYYSKTLVDTKSAEQRFIIARKLYELGISTHMRDKARGLNTIRALNEALPVFREQKSWFLTVEGLIRLADAHTLRGERAQADRCLTEAANTIRHYPPTDSSTERIYADLMEHIGDVRLDRGEYGLARQNLNYALVVFQKEITPEHKEGLAFCLRSLGEHASATGDYRKAEKYLTEAAQRMIPLKETQTWAAVQGDIGVVYLREGHPDKALPYFSNGLKVWEQQGQGFWTAKFKGNLALTHLYLGKQAREAGKEKNAPWHFREARQLAEESFRIFTASNGPVSCALPLSVLGRLDILEEHPENGSDHLNQSLTYRRQSNEPRGLAETLEFWAQSEHDAGQSQKAIKALKEAAALRNAAGTPVPPCDQKDIARLRRELGLPPL